MYVENLGGFHLKWTLCIFTEHIRHYINRVKQTLFAPAEGLVCRYVECLDTAQIVSLVNAGTKVQDQVQNAGVQASRTNYRIFPFLVTNVIIM